MADELQYSSRSDNKRKYDSQTTPPLPPRPAPHAAPQASRRRFPPNLPNPTTRRLSPVVQQRASPMDEIQLAKQRAQEIAARSSSATPRPSALASRTAPPSMTKTRGSAAPPPLIMVIQVVTFVVLSLKVRNLVLCFGGADYGQNSYGQHLGQGGNGGSGDGGMGFRVRARELRFLNGRVGVIIGKSGETIKYLQVQSGAKIQVGLIIGKGGETIKNMQANSGKARIQALLDDSLATIICFNVRCWIPLFAVEQYMVLDSFYIYIPVGILPNLIIVGTPMFPLFDVVDFCLKVTLFRVVPCDSVHDDFDIMSGLDNRKEIGLSGDSQAFIERIYKVFSQFFLTLLDIGNGWRVQPARGYRAPQSHGWGPPGPPSTQAGYGYMQPGAYPGQPPQYNMPQQPYTGYPPQQASLWMGPIRRSTESANYPGQWI
ncbi:hypothetical protein Scep_008205 [Stephania cephalantha]|uniref:K Homology domain-containing protein n=1 Tax=Stephania cephalantha TaxID=152367 RepID=A0AAP0KD09_9MAGN